MAARPKPLHASQDAPLQAQDVARGVGRLFFRRDLFALCEVPLPNGRRADMMAICPAGLLTIVEIKVSRADLLGDASGRIISIIATASSGRCRRASPGAARRRRKGPDCSGLIVADRYDAEILREAPLRKLAPARRKAETLRFARRAARRLAGDIDPGLAEFS
jgi:hypothetical protein